MELPEGTLTIFKNKKSTQEEQSPGQSPRPHNLLRKPKRQKSTPTGNPKQLVVADDNDDKKPKKKRTKPENNKLMIGQDPQPISSEDSVKKFETRMTPIHLFQLIIEINKPTDLTKEPDAVDYRQLQRQAIRDMGFGALLDLKIKNISTVLCSFLANNFQTSVRQGPLNGNNVLDIKQEDVVTILGLPHGPKPVEEFKHNDPAITDHVEMVDAFKKRMGYSNKFLPTRSTAAQLIAGRKDFGDDFKRDFLVFVVSTFLHGNTTSRITMNILKSLVNMNEVTEYNWCQYVIDALVKGCKSHHDGKPFTGPITFFLLCYLDRCKYERAHPRSFPVIKCWDQKMLDDRLRLQGSNFTDVQTLERLKKPSSAASRDEHPEGESQKKDTQTNPNTQQDLAALYENFYQLIITISKTVLHILEKEMELKIEPDEQAKRTIKILTDAMVSMSRKMPPPPSTTQHQQEQQEDQQDLQDAQIYIEIDKAQGLEQLNQTNDEDSLPVGKSVPTSKEVVVDEQQTQPQAHGTNISTTEKKRSHQDSTGWDSGVTSTYTRRSRSIGTKKRKVFKDPTIPHFNMGIFSSQEDSYETTQEKNTEEDITGSVNLDKDVNETIEAEEYPVPSALDETKNPTPSIDEIIRRASSPASNSLSDTKKLEMIAAAAEEVEKNSKEADELDEELTKTVEKILNEKPKRRNPPRVHRLPERFRKLLFEFGKIIWAERTTFYSMREGTWIENSIIDAWAVILNKEEAKSDSPRRIFFGVSSFGSNKEEIEFTFYERLGLELEEQGLTVTSMLAAKAFRFFKSYVAFVFPRIELVSAQYTFTEVTLPSHKDKTPNAENCRIYTMHHMERYDGGEYEDGTTLDFNTGNIKECR
ncbi:OLC1v1012926C1 [Oldenlandia corymbosa var. corymbosa]|uniref:OLC1v1012926C1 n=1 Tax=Oldenlandia corymbosa var. corymbosa TaxID=529605 RepID=A0AAV1DYZ8_OLDCO|nr:OLC1v1012926C1 [Oldenlandia corymbosa var. corymbosa]